MPSSPSHNSVLRFGAFEFAPQAGILYRNGRSVALQPQPSKVLSMLISRPGELITREEIQLHVWGKDTFVDFEHNINFAVRQIRAALKDDAEKPRFIETLPRRGYRFIATVEKVAPSSRTVLAGSYLLPAKGHSVGRERERAELATAFESAVGGNGVLLCVAGEPGIGKTTLVQDFLSDLQASGKSFNLAAGRCSQRLAGEEAYLPFLEALETLLSSNVDGVAHKLRTLAPSWYAQLFPLSESDPSDARLQEYVRTTTQERMKRELTAFLQEVARQAALFLFFDDLHWADASTVDLLSHLATKFDSARILVIVTYRPTELLLLKHPFIGVKRDLQGRALCREIEVEFLSPSDVERYIALEFLGNRFPREFAALIHSRTEGNPLFMVDLLRYFRDRKVIVKKNEDASWQLAQSLPDLSRNIPQSVNGVIERKIDQLSDRDLEVLTAAAVQGYECDSAAVARALAAENMEIEEILDRLERVHAFVRRVSEEELPGGAPTVRYRFVHVLYQNAVYARLTPSRRVGLSAALAHTLEALYGDRRSAIASQLAFLYETARDLRRATDYFLLAAQNAQRLFANQEAVALARRGLVLLDKTPETPEHTRKELDLQITLAFSLLFTRGYGALEVRENMARARELCERLGDTAQLFAVLFGSWLNYITAPQIHKARQTAEHMLGIACETNNSALLLMAHGTLGITLLHEGEIAAAQKELEEGIKYHDPAQYRLYLELYRLDPGINGRSESVRTLWLLGYPDQARRRLEETLALARTVPIPPSLAFALWFAASFYQQLHETDKARQMAAECLEVCNEHGVPSERAWATCLYGWAVAELGKVEEGISHIRAGLDAQLSTGIEVDRTRLLALLAEALRRASKPEEGLKVVMDGLAISELTGNSYYDAELWRLKGELLSVQGETAKAEDSCQKAIEIARQQAAKSLELRASTSLARLWQKQGKRKEAHQLLSDIYAWFTEGFDTADLMEAKSLVGELS